MAEEKSAQVKLNELNQRTSNVQEVSKSAERGHTASTYILIGGGVLATAKVGVAAAGSACTSGAIAATAAFAATLAAAAGAAYAGAKLGGEIGVAVGNAIMNDDHQRRPSATVLSV